MEGLVISSGSGKQRVCWKSMWRALRALDIVGGERNKLIGNLCKEAQTSFDYLITPVGAPLEVVVDSAETVEEDGLTRSRNHTSFQKDVLRIAPSFVRKIFDVEFHPDKLQATLRNEHQKINDMILKKTIKKSQQRLLYSKDVSSQKLDMTMMICLLRHIANFPIADSLPSVYDKSVAADLSRLKYYRNLIVHVPNGTISDEDFKVYFDNVRE
ncbi:Hypothetical predicted protein, partial [Mytilus galloprovincialis]